MGYLSVIVVGVMALAVLGHGWPFSYQDDVEEEPDSEEFGQFAGTKKPSCKCGWTNKSFGRIVGGRTAHENEFPYVAHVAVETSWGMGHVCGATLLTPNHVMTAAHCTSNADNNYYVTTAQHNVNMPSDRSRMYRVERVINHPEYNIIPDHNDISLLVMAEMIVFNQFVGPVCLPSLDSRIDLEGQWVKIAGWGHTQFYGSGATELQKVSLKVTNSEECVRTYAANNITITRGTQLCTYGYRKDSCQGDSGGPLLWLDPMTNRYTVVGVISYGMACADGTPAVNTDVQAFLPWILATIRDNQRGSDTTCHLN